MIDSLEFISEIMCIWKCFYLLFLQRGHISMINCYTENQDIFIDILVRFMKIKIKLIIQIMRKAKYIV